MPLAPSDSQRGHFIEAFAHVQLEPKARVHALLKHVIVF